MTRRILITRPREDAERLAETLSAHGITPVIAPMMTVEPVSGPALDLNGVQALLATSANGARALASRTPIRDRPLFAVGHATAAAARALGFSRVAVAGGDAAALAALVADRLDPAGGPLIHAAGETVAGDLAGRLAASGFGCRRLTLYRACAAQALPVAATDALRAGTVDGVALFSPRTVRIFIDLCGAAGLAGALANCHAFCLSAAVAAAAGAAHWRAVTVADRPTGDALVAAVLANA